MPFEVNILGLDTFIKVAVTDLLLSMVIVAGPVSAVAAPDQFRKTHPEAGIAKTSTAEPLASKLPLAGVIVPLPTTAVVKI